MYSRCRQEPTLTTGLAPTPDWQTARGCDLYELPLTGTPTERKLDGGQQRQPVRDDALDVARRSRSRATPTAGSCPDPLSRRQDHAAALGGGSVQICRETALLRLRRAHDGVDQLDLGPSRAAYVWRMTGGAVYGVGSSGSCAPRPLAGGRRCCSTAA